MNLLNKMNVGYYVGPKVSVPLCAEKIFIMTQYPLLEKGLLN